MGITVPFDAVILKESPTDLFLTHHTFYSTHLPTDAVNEREKGRKRVAQGRD